MKYFTLKELTSSDVARKNNLDNMPNSEQAANLVRLTDTVLDPLREFYGAPIFVNSGFRSKEVNNLISGSARASAHCQGNAADIRSKSNTREDNKKLFDAILESGVPFTKLINEYDYKWIHIAFDGDDNKMILDAKKDKSGVTIYTWNKNYKYYNAAEGSEKQESILKV